jgi:hypothetical protein
MMRNGEKALIVSRHAAVAQFVRAERYVFASATVLTGTISADDVRGRLVAGVLPFHLAALCERFWAVEFTGPPPRGQEYTLDEMRAAGAHLVEYRVSKVPEASVTLAWCNKQQSRDRQARLLLLGPGDRAEYFFGESIPGVCAATVAARERAGKWSSTTFRLTLAEGVRAIPYHQGWNTFTEAEGLGLPADASPAEVAAGLGISAVTLVTAVTALAARSRGATRQLEAWVAAVEDQGQLVSAAATPQPIVVGEDAGNKGCTSGMAEALRRAGLLPDAR